MSVKMMSSSKDEEKDLQKQIGCMNGIFQLFDRQQFLSGRRMSSHNHKKLLLGAQHPLEPHNATTAVIEKDLPLELQKEKPRLSTESSQSSYSSSAFSSLDHNRKSQPQRLSRKQTNTSESQSQITAVKEEHPSLIKGHQCPDIRHVVKDSMYREARGVSIKSFASDERKVTVMKHIDSPRPLQQSKFEKPRATAYEGSTCFLSKVQKGTKNSKDERLTLPRFSYDGRESRETFKTTMKLKELPRLSLDSKASSMKSSALDESRLDYSGRDQVLLLKQEAGSHSRSSSIVAKLMGLDDFPDTISTDESWITTIKSSPSSGASFLSKSSITSAESKQKQVSLSQPVLPRNPATSSPRLRDANSVRKPTTCSRLPVEPAPWKQQNCGRGSPKMSMQSRKTTTNTTHPSCSVYGEIEKRITELEFKRSGKDLRALKQILEAMQKTREKLENQRAESTGLAMQWSCSSEDSCSSHNPNLLMWQNRETPVGVMKSAKVMEKVKISSPTQGPTMGKPKLQYLQTQGPKYHRKSPGHREKAKEISPTNSMKELSPNLPSTDKMDTWRNLESERSLRASQRMRIESCTTSGRDVGIMSPRLQRNVLRIEGESNPNTPSLESGGVKKHSCKKVRQKCPQNRKHKVKSMDLQLSDDQLSELSSETRLSSYHGDTASIISDGNNSVASNIETEVLRLANSINTSTREPQNSVSTRREHISAVELTSTMIEQPSPVSVLDTTFYSEDSPSPVKKISTAFQDESSTPDEAEWHLENLNCISDFTKSGPGDQYNQKPESMLHLVHEPRFSKIEGNEAAATHNEAVYWSLDPCHRYINKILQGSGLLKDTSNIPTAEQLLYSRPLINPDMFHVLEETEDHLEKANGELTEKNDQIKLNQKIERRIVFDVVNEMLVRKITSGGLCTIQRKGMGMQGLVKEVYMEIDHLCRIPYSNLDDDVDRWIMLLSADMKYQPHEWTDHSGEVPALVLNIERLIFKDLINEIVTGEVLGLHDRPKRHCRQLFTK